MRLFVSDNTMIINTTESVYDKMRKIAQTTGAAGRVNFKHSNYFEYY